MTRPHFFMLFQKNQPLPILTCSACHGTGVVGMLPCRACRGMMRGRLVRGFWLYFGLPLSRYNIALRKGREWLYRFEVIGSLVFAFGFLGLAAYRLYQLEAYELLLTRQFWIESDFSINPAPTLIWLALIFILFLIYRHLARRKKRDVVEQRGFEKIEIDQLQALPEDWKAARRVSRSRRKDIARTLTPEAVAAVEEAYRAADHFGSPAVLPAHFFYAVLGNPSVAGLFVRLGIPSKTLRAKVAAAFGKKKRDKGPTLSDDAEQILFQAYEYAYGARQEYVHVTEILLATVRQSERLQELLYDLNVDSQKLANVIEWVRVREKLRRQYQIFRKAAAGVSKYGMDKAMTAVATPFLNSFSQDLTLAAKFGHLEPCVARDGEIEEIFRIIEGGRQSVALVGDHGVGKMSVVEGIVARMIEGAVPKRLRDKRLVQISTSALLAGTTVSGAQERLLRMMNEIRRAGNIILFINGIHDLVGGSPGEGGEGLDVSEALSEHLGPGGVVAFATTTVDGFNRHISNSQLGNVMARVDIKEMNENQAIQVLESKAGPIEYKHNVFFSYDALEQAVRLAKRYLHDQNLPESAIALMSESAALARSRKGGTTLVSADDVGAVVAQKTGVPATSISADESSKLLRLEEVMHSRLIGQDEAVKLVADALRRARAQIRSTKKPISSFLFLGPTGVGKTELAKTIAEVYFGGEDRMIRVDMSEYQDKSAIYRLIGRPGEQGTGLLTEAVRQRPFSLVLLDEMEKADPDILTLFLQVFDDGRLTDSIGRVIDFTNTIIIATSNAGTQYVQDERQKGVSLADIREAMIRSELKKYYRPEFLNRFDGIVLFKPLEREEIKQVAKLMLKRVAKDLEARGVGFRVEDAGIEALCTAGFDPEFGARPMRRAIQEKVENQLAELILSDKLGRRDTVVLGEGAELKVERAK